MSLAAWISPASRLQQRPSEARTTEGFYEAGAFMSREIRNQANRLPSIKHKVGLPSDACRGISSV